MISISTARARRRAARSRFFATDLGARATQLVGNELAENMLQYFDPVERGRALAVNRRWRVVGARLEALDAGAMWQSELAHDSRVAFEYTEKFDEYLKTEWLVAGELRTVFPRPLDPLAFHLAHLFENGLSARVEDSVGEDGTSSAASFVELFRFLQTMHVRGYSLIIAPKSEMPKWMTALQELPDEVPVARCFYAFERIIRGNSGSRPEVYLHLCTYEEAAEHWDDLCQLAEWKYIVLDEGDGCQGDWPWLQRHHGATYGFSNISCTYHYILYQPGRRLTFEAAMFHLCYMLPWSRRDKYDALFAWADDDRFTSEVIRRAVSSFLGQTPMSAAPGYRLGRAHEHILTQAAATHA